MKEQATLTFKDAASGDEACVIIRYSASNVAIALSLASNGDVEIVLPRADVDRLIEALTSARSKM